MVARLLFHPSKRKRAVERKHAAKIKRAAIRIRTIDRNMPSIEICRRKIRRRRNQAVENKHAASCSADMESTAMKCFADSNGQNIDFVLCKDIKFLVGPFLVRLFLLRKELLLEKALFHGTWNVSQGVFSYCSFLRLNFESTKISTRQRCHRHLDTQIDNRSGIFRLMYRHTNSLGLRRLRRARLACRHRSDKSCSG